MSSVLTNIKCQKAQPIQGKKYRLYDSGGMYLEVAANGGKYWRLKYYYLKKEKLLSLGTYPLMSLLEARTARDEAKKLLTQGVDPSQAKKQEKRQALINAANTFESVAREWHSNQLDKWSKEYASDLMTRLEVNIFPDLGGRPITEIDAPELLEVLRKIEKRGATYMSGRIKQNCGQIFRYGIATSKCRRDPSADLRGALKAHKEQHFAAIEIDEIPEFLTTLERNEARLYSRTRRGIKLLMLTLVRTSELIEASWETDRFDFDKGIWEIPAERMKMRKPHVVPLSKQAIALFKELKEETAHLNSQWVFPSLVRPMQHLSNNTILQGIYSLGYSGRMTGHGFRALGMSAIKERLGYRHEVVDRQLAHVPKDKVDRAYDRAKFLDERVKMMQEWSNYIDKMALKKATVTKMKNAM